MGDFVLGGFGPIGDLVLGDYIRWDFILGDLVRERVFSASHRFPQYISKTFYCHSITWNDFKLTIQSRKTL